MKATISEIHHTFYRYKFDDQSNIVIFIRSNLQTRRFMPIFCSALSACLATYIVMYYIIL